MFKSIFNGGLSNLVDSIFSGIDKVSTTTEEKKKLKALIAKQVQDFDKSINEQLTERHKIDMLSDNRLSKNIRPLTLIYMLILLTVLIALDSVDVLGFSVAAHWIELIKWLAIAAFSYYFVGREFTKVAKGK